MSPVLDSNGSLVVKRRSAEELEKELRGGDGLREHSLHLSEGLPKSEGPLQTPLLTLGGSSSDQASTSKQPLYGASVSREDIFSLGGLSYLTSSKSCGSRSLGCVNASFLLSLFPFSFPAFHKRVPLQGRHIGQRDGELRNLPPDPAGGTFSATPVY